MSEDFATRFPSTFGLFQDDKKETKSSDDDTYVPTREDIEKTRTADFTAGSELIEKPIEMGGQVPKEDLLAMRYAPPFAGLSAFPFLSAVPRLAKDEDDPFRKARLDKITSEIGGEYSYDSKEVSDKLNVSTIAKLGFADNKLHVENALEQQFGAGNFKVVEDTGAGFLDNRFFVSVKREDGTFTPFTNPTQDLLTRALKYVPMGTYEVTSDIAAVTASFLTSAVVTTTTSAIPGIGPGLAVVTGPLSLGYSLYVYNKGAERGRQYIQKALGLTKGEADDFGTFIEEIHKLALDPKIGQALKKLFNDPTADITSNEFKQELRGIIGFAFPFFPALFDKVSIGLSRVREKLELKGPVQEQDIYKSAIDAEKFADLTGLRNTMLPQRTMNKKISRLAGIIDQVSGKLSQGLRLQMQSAYNYLKNFSKNIGEGNFAEFRNAMSSFNKTLTGIREGRIPKPDPERLGVKLSELENMFYELRLTESRGMYNNIFTKLKDSTFDLEKIRAFIVGRETRNVEPISGQKPNQPFEAATKPLVQGEPKLDSIVEHLFALGRESGGIRKLSKESVKKAVEVLRKNHPEYAKYMDGHNIQIKTPAELLHMYSTMLGNMSKAVFAKDTGTAANPQLAQFAMGLRETILETIAKPLGGKVDVTKDLAAANAFYKETLDKISSLSQEASRIQIKTGGEKTMLPEEFGITPGASKIGKRSQITLQNIRFQEEYVKNALAGTGKKPPIGELQQAFSDIIAYKLGGAGTPALTKSETAQSVKSFLESYSTRELELLGLSQKNVKQLYKDLDIITKLEETQLAQTYMLGSRMKNIEMKSIFENAIGKKNAAEFTQDVDAMLAVIAKLPKKEAAAATDNLRKSLFDFIISKESGVLFEITNKNAAFAQVGDITINPTKLNEVIEKFNSAGVFDKILNKKVKVAEGKEISEKEMLLGIQNYVGVISQAGADAGSALSGAQLISNLFTLDPRKFIDAVARISAQGRLAVLFSNKKFADVVSGIGKPTATTRAGRIKRNLKTFMFGKGSVANVVAQVALQGGMEYRRAQDAASNQTMEMLNMDMFPGTRGLFDQTNEALGQ